MRLAVLRAFALSVPVDLPLLLLIAPLLLFPRGAAPLAGLLALLVLWLRALAVDRGSARSTPLDLPILLLLAMAVEALAPSTDLTLSLPKLYGLVFGFAVYYGVVRSVSSRRGWWIVAGLLMAAVVGVAAVGLVATRWVEKLPGSAGVVDSFPRLITSVESSQGVVTGINTNELGGTLAFLLPLPMGVLLWMPWNETTRSRRSWGASGTSRGFWRSLMLLASLWLVVAVGAAILLLSFSRGSLAAFGLVLLLLLGLRWRSFGYLLAVAALAGSVILAATGPGVVYEELVRLDRATSTTPSLEQRHKMWGQTIQMIQGAPLTGIGLNTFPLVIHDLSPNPTPLVDLSKGNPHAHNVYLQTAVDLGLGGLMAFFGLWAVVARLALSAYRAARSRAIKGAVAGLAAGCLAYLLYGMADAITLGAKPLFLLWAMVGLIVVAEREAREGQSGAWQLAAQRSPLGAPHNPRLSALNPISVLRRIARALSWCYWLLAILFTAMAYLLAAVSLLGRLA